MRYIGIDLGTSAAKLLQVASERGPGMGGAMLACEEYGTVADACKALVCGGYRSPGPHPGGKV